MSATKGPSEEEIQRKWPLHWLVWKDDHKALKRLLEDKDAPKDLEQLDPRGRTPLHLAVTLNRVNCTHLLLFHNATPLAENRHKWSVLNEAICTGNPELIGVVLRIKDKWQEHIRTKEVPQMLERLHNAPDFYMEMKWELSSWLPFVTRMCPSDTCRIWKRGTAVRIDSTLVGFEKMGWKRGQQTLIFQATSTGHRVCDINHGDKTVWEREFNVMTPDPVQKMLNMEMEVLRKMRSPVVSTFVNTENISFERQKSGIWGFRSDKTENVGGFHAKVFGSSGLEIVTNIRVEHLPETEKHKHRSINPLHEFFGADQDHLDTSAADMEAPPHAQPTLVTTDNKPHLTMTEYFTEPDNKEDYDALSRPPEVFTRTQKLKASVSLAEEYPLSLQEQILPIIDLMAMNTPHFSKVKDFISLQMPSGFPVKFEIPLFHVISVKVSFHNVNGQITPAPHLSLSSSRRKSEPAAVLTPPSSPLEVGGVKRRHCQAGTSEAAAVSSVDQPSRDNGMREENSRDEEVVEVCTISDECFAVPGGYRRLYGGGRGTVDQEEELLQMAIQQSLREQQQPIRGKEVQLSLQEALKDEELIRTCPTLQPDLGPTTSSGTGVGRVSSNSVPTSSEAPSSSVQGQLSTEETDLELAIALSRELALEEEKQRMVADDEELERVLKMSLLDK